MNLHTANTLRDVFEEVLGTRVEGDMLLGLKKYSKLIIQWFGQ